MGKFELVEGDSYPFRSWAISVKEQGAPFEYSSAESGELVATSTMGGFIFVATASYN